MARIGKVILIIALVLVVMLIITYSSDSVRLVAQKVATQNHLPLWLVGLAGPILFLFDRLAKGLSGLLPDSATEAEIRTSNDAIKSKIAELDASVRRLDEWRENEVRRHAARLEELQRAIDPIEARDRAADARIDSLLQRRDELRGALRVNPDLEP